MWLRLGSILVIAITLLVVLMVTNGVLAASRHDQKATEHKEPSTGSTGPFKQQIITSPDYRVRQGTKSYTQACPSNTTLTGGGYQLLKGHSGVTFPASYPSTTNSSTWTVIINNPRSDEATFRVYAVCLSAQTSSSTPTPRPMPKPQPMPTPIPPTPTQVVQPTPVPNNGNNGNNNGGNGNNGGSPIQGQDIKLKF